MPWSVSVENNENNFNVSFDKQTNELNANFQKGLSMDSEFADETKKFNLTFSETEANFETDFGETTVVGGGVGGDCSCTPSYIKDVVDEYIKENPLKTDESLSYVGGVLSVNRANEPDPDNTLPITAAAVATTVGNIEILLQTI